MVVIDFFVKTDFSRPGLHLWNADRTLANLKALGPGPQAGWWHFSLNVPSAQIIEFKLFDWNQAGTGARVWERFNRRLDPDPTGQLPGQVWFGDGAGRVLDRDPFGQAQETIRLHLITAKRYRDGHLYIWGGKKPAQVYPASGSDEWGPYFDLTLSGERQYFFNFKFIRQDGQFETDFANRLWAASDGAEIWTHSEGAALLTSPPLRHELRLHLGHTWGDQPLWLHLWQENSDFATTIPATSESEPGWVSFSQAGLYSGIAYSFMLTTQNPQGSNPNPVWEHYQARRTVALQADAEYWTLEGDPTLFTSPPARNQPVQVEISAQDPGHPLGQISRLEVRINQARADLPPQVEPQADGTWRFWTYPGLTTAFRFGNEARVEPVYHRLHTPLSLSSPPPEIKTYVVTGRAPLLCQPARPDLFEDPPFVIDRQGVVEQAGHLRFVLHAPWCSRVRLWGEWLGPDRQGLDLKSSRDGAYWWWQIPLNELVAGLPAEFGEDYHGARYHFRLNDGSGNLTNTAINGAKVVQDPAADWVESSDPAAYSRLVNHGRYQWQSQAWHTPGWEYLQIYQLHPRRFTRRNQLNGLPLPPLQQITQEITNGYLKNLGATALLLMPLNEFEGQISWGYNPSYFYAVEESYGGPEALKELVDVCHHHGLAVLLDVEFNHLGTGHNILWETARESFIDGDTQWGSLVNFDHPLCRVFFAQNLAFWLEMYHIDGFRFDHTKTIIEGHNPAYYFIRQPGSGGGWEFLLELRRRAKSTNPHCLLMAEQLPNDWALTGPGGPMDTQWADEFHDRIVDVCRGFGDRMDRFAEALSTSHIHGLAWYNVTNYAESHDEVGNVNDRIAQIAGLGRGLRMGKVAAAAVLLSRGIPLFFMGEESGEAAQFSFGLDDELDLTGYETEENRIRVRRWWQVLLNLRRHNPKIQGPAPLRVHYVEDLLIAFSRGEGSDFYAILNFGSRAHNRNLSAMNLPEGLYKELWNSSWPAFQVEWEDEHPNGGREARLQRGHNLNIPDFGVIILEKV